MPEGITKDGCLKDGITLFEASRVLDRIALRISETADKKKISERDTLIRTSKLLAELGKLQIDLMHRVA